MKLTPFAKIFLTLVILGVLVSGLVVAMYLPIFKLGQVLQPQSYDLMIAPRKLSSGKTSSYGCGLRTETQNGDLILQHTGGVSGDRLAFRRTQRIAVRNDGAGALGRGLPAVAVADRECP